MTDFVKQPNADGLVKLTGTIRNLKVTRASASFVFTESDQTKMGVIAIAAAIAGLGGQAMRLNFRPESSIPTRSSLMKTECRACGLSSVSSSRFLP